MDTLCQLLLVFASGVILSKYLVQQLFREQGIGMEERHAYPETGRNEHVESSHGHLPGNMDYRIP